MGTYARLREALGLEAAAGRPAPPAGITELLLRRLCATLIAARRLPPADLAAAPEIPVPACRELLLAARPRLAALGCTVTEDGIEVCLGYAEEVAGAVRRVSLLEDDVELSSEQLAILALLAVHGPLTRAQIEAYRGEDSKSLLRRLAGRGIVARARDDKEVGAPYLYRLTAKALGLLGVPTIEVLRARVLETAAALPPPLAATPFAPATAPVRGRRPLGHLWRRPPPCVRAVRSDLNPRVRSTRSSRALR